MHIDSKICDCPLTLYWISEAIYDRYIATVEHEYEVIYDCGNIDNYAVARINIITFSTDA